MIAIAKIKKRDGRVVEFDRAKIKYAMEQAALAVNPDTDIRPYSLMTDHVIRYIELKFEDGTPDVESIQDMVEQTLMEFGYYEVAKAYILYRAQRSKERAGEVLTPSASPSVIGEASHVYTNTEGTRLKIVESELRARFERASAGFPDVDIDLMLGHCKASLYDGASESEFGDAVVFAARNFIEKDPSYSFVAARLHLENMYWEVLKVPHGQDIRRGYRDGFINNIRICIDSGRIVPEMKTYDLEVLADYLDPTRDGLLEYLGVDTLYDRYLIKEEGGERRLETPQIFWMRVAMGLAMNETEEVRVEKVKEFYDTISTLRYVPSTPTLFHAGTSHPQLSSCYLNTVEDDLGHIFKVFGDNSQLSKYSGGIGTDWTNIRGTGAIVKATNIGSQGVIPFLKIANDVTVAINRSGKRRGATCAYLETWHYDIEDFLDLRRNTGDERRRTHDMNTANWIPDLFLKRVNADETWTLFSPDETSDLHHLYGRAFEDKYIDYETRATRGGIKLFKTLQAKDLWRKMIGMLFETGHPWITFKDACNIRSPQDHVGVIHSSNLCTEITLNTSETETAVCNLGSVNLSRHMKEGRLDELLIEQTVATAMRMLDNVVDVNFYPTVEAKHSNLLHRPVGLGIMGFQDALYMADINFDSEEAVEFADSSMELISYHAILGSSLLAKERGAYESFKGSKWDRGIFPIDTLDVLESERGRPIGVARTSRLDWTPVRHSVKQYGMRNSNTMASAPTATISNISGCFPCIEPIYKNLYVKANMSGDFTVVNSYLVKDLKSLGLWSEGMLEDLKYADGSIADLTTIPPKLRAKYKDVFEIDTECLIKIAAYRGKWIDQSQSFNIFFRGTSGKRLGEMYMLAWHLGLKTTYYLRTLAATSVEKSTVDLRVDQASISTFPQAVDTKIEGEAEKVGASLGAYLSSTMSLSPPAPNSLDGPMASS